MSTRARTPVRPRKWYDQIKEALQNNYNDDEQVQLRRRHPQNFDSSNDDDTMMSITTPSSSTSSSSSSASTVVLQPRRAFHCCFATKRHTQVVHGHHGQNGSLKPGDHQYKLIANDTHLHQNYQDGSVIRDDNANVVSERTPTLAPKWSNAHNQHQQMNDVTAAHAIEKMDATELLKRMANGTLPIHAMSIWNSTLLSIWATTGELHTQQLFGETDKLQLPTLSLCSEPYKILCRYNDNGSYGRSYIARHTKTHELATVKVEEPHERKLQSEAMTYQLLLPPADNAEQCLLGIGRVRFCVHRRALLLPVLGPSLDDLLAYCNRQFSIATVALIGVQMISRLEHIHHCGVVHRDIRPSNLHMGVGIYKNVLYMVDYGVSKRWRLLVDTPCLAQLPTSTSHRDLDDTIAEHVAKAEDGHLAASARYASQNAHMGIEQSRRDDLESLGYVLAYFLRGSLPWQGLHAANKQAKMAKIAQKKMSTTPEQLFKGYPAEFAGYQRFVRSMGFTERPDYSHLRHMLISVAQREGAYTDGYEFDWQRRASADHNNMPNHIGNNHNESVEFEQHDDDFLLPWPKHKIRKHGVAETTAPVRTLTPLRAINVYTTPLL